MTTIVISLTQPARTITLEYEMKLLLKPTAVLGLDNGLMSTPLSIFDMPPAVTKLDVRILSTSCK
ncbi:hypothetical protein FOMA001_g17991 [Fusarium oxysporum f. sp. matthiolae]|nr:hypothetical protein FOMA001_g17991 [Fusarium oxysporum f. sp. matthiolae]